MSKAKSASSVPDAKTAQISCCQNHICIHFWPQLQLVYLRAQQAPLMFSVHMLAVGFLIICSGHKAHLT